MLHTARTFAKPQISLLQPIADSGHEVWRMRLNRSRGFPAVLYGKGDLGKMAKEYLSFVGRTVIAHIDQGDLSKRMDHLHDIPCLVSIANHPYVPIERSLADLGFQHIAPFYDICESYRHIHPLSNGWFADPFSSEDLANISSVYDRWDDDTSRAHYLQFLAWRRLREEWSFEDAPVTTDDRYFIPEVVSVLHDHEVFVDGGAYDGRVSAEFSSRFGGEIYAFEADPESWKSIRPLLRASKFRLSNAVLGEHRGSTLFHHGYGYASQVWNIRDGDSMDGEMRDQIRLDDTLADPSFLKLHLEGHELAALRGAEATLERCRPILAITAYHNDDGLWRLPLHLMDSLSDYRWLWRNHSWVGTGAVVYGIPQERTK